MAAAVVEIADGTLGSIDPVDADQSMARMDMDMWDNAFDEDYADRELIIAVQMFVAAVAAADNGHLERANR